MSEENIKKESSEQAAPDEGSPLPEGMVPAFYVIYNTKDNSFGLIGAPGFLEDRVRAFGALAMAQQQLMKYYSDIDKAKASIITRVKNFDAKASFNRFINRKH